MGTGKCGLVSPMIRSQERSDPGAQDRSRLSEKNCFSVAGARRVFLTSWLLGFLEEVAFMVDLEG